MGSARHEEKKEEKDETSAKSTPTGEEEKEEEQQEHKRTKRIESKKRKADADRGSARHEEKEEEKDETSAKDSRKDKAKPPKPGCGAIIPEDWDGARFSEYHHDNATGHVSSMHPEVRSLAGQPWFREAVVDPPGFKAFKDSFESFMKTKPTSSSRWILARDPEACGLGNTMMAIASAIILAALTGRRFGYWGKRIKFCGWMDSTVCAWIKQTPPEILETASKYWNLPSDDLHALHDPVRKVAVEPRGCEGLAELVCSHNLTSRPIVILTTCLWLFKPIEANAFFKDRLHHAFSRILPSGREVMDVYGPMSRWLFKPNAKIESIVNGYRNQMSLGGTTPICIQGRWGVDEELQPAKACIASLVREPWWPKHYSVHVGTMNSEFRNMVCKLYGDKHRVGWCGKAVAKEKADEQAYVDMLLLGSCDLAVLPNGASTYSYMSTALFHSVALRDSNANVCGNLRNLRYEQLFPEPRGMLDKTCFQTMKDKDKKKFSVL